MLKLKKVGIDTFQENVAFLARSCPIHKGEAFRALAKIDICCGSKKIQATLNLVDDPAILKPDELGLSEIGFERLGVAEGSEVSIAHISPPVSLDFVRQKIQGVPLNQASYDAIINDIARHQYSKMEIAAFLVGCASQMSTDEVLCLTRAMAGTGERMNWHRPLVVDKHCIGGIPGNRTSMIVVPIVAAHGLCIPKTSSRAITSPAGTADTMEVLANVEADLAKIYDIVDRIGGCLVWGGTAHLSPADDALISVERPLALDTPEQMVASILSKKFSAGSTHLAIDLPIGPSAKIRDHAAAIRLKKMFQFVGRELGLEVNVLVSPVAGPIGRGIGPVLEARDVLNVLHQRPERPLDLEARAITLAGAILEFDPNLRGGCGISRAKELLANGSAAAKMDQIIMAQGARKAPKLGNLVFEIPSPANGRVESIDCFRISRGARLAGAPGEPGAGIDLLHAVGSMVRAGEPLYRVHSNLKSDFDFAQAFLSEDSGYRILSP